MLLGGLNGLQVKQLVWLPAASPAFPFLCPAQPPPSPCSRGFAGPPLPFGSLLCSAGRRYKLETSNVRREECVLGPWWLLSPAQAIQTYLPFPTSSSRMGLATCLLLQPWLRWAQSFQGWCLDPETSPPVLPPHGHTLHQFL